MSKYCPFIYTMEEECMEDDCMLWDEIANRCQITSMFRLLKVMVMPKTISANIPITELLYAKPKEDSDG